MTRDLDRRNSIVGLLALVLASMPMLHIGNSALGAITAISVIIVLIHYGLLIAIGALTRNMIIKIATVVLAFSFLLLDTLSITGIFNIHSLVSPAPPDFIYFQF